MNTVKFIGMDVHKKTITIAIADEDRQKQPRSYGAITNDLDALDKFCRKMVSTSSRLHFVYEAGPAVTAFTVISPKKDLTAWWQPLQ